MWKEILRKFALIGKESFPKKKEGKKFEVAKVEALLLRTTCGTIRIYDKRKL